VSKIVIAVPVKNEEERITRCLDAFLGQSQPADQIILLLNNCTDNTAATCAAYARRSGSIQIIACELPASVASAGEARRLALNAAAMTRGAGVILTTDADAAVPPSWVEDNLRWISAGAELVCGQAVIDAQEARLIPDRLHADHQAETDCLARNDQIDALINRDPIDVWPRHQQNSGASIAMTLDILRRSGGPPRVAASEDRALIERARRVDGRIRHAPEIFVTVSGRLEGRATGGMAETIRRRMQVQDMFADAALEPAVDAYRRALAKARLRRLWLTGTGADRLAEDLLLDRAAISFAARAAYFGRAWAHVQKASPVLRRRLVPYRDLARETRQAEELCNQLLQIRPEARMPPELQPAMRDRDAAD